MAVDLDALFARRGLCGQVSAITLDRALGSLRTESFEINSCVTSAWLPYVEQVWERYKYKYSRYDRRLPRDEKKKLRECCDDIYNQLETFCIITASVFSDLDRQKVERLKYQRNARLMGLLKDLYFSEYDAKFERKITTIQASISATRQAADTIQVYLADMKTWL
ncbi:hypothetical protein H072_8628 [Dactylellina haptotyla CBS 200.50]|uniref:Uncharacterized protein n=1 Tax=Dactylellina haptotyla (strain CBS 200.50) TaxID=1284197 RepID=S8A4G0_DACHA|nr:hypothetical protein H072_8628 [Dactylellina haptotyla CBS 200.50]